MSEMRLRIAEAIYHAAGIIPMEDAEVAADEVLAALMNPTAEMQAAGDRALGDGYQTIPVYRAMIEAA